MDEKNIYYRAQKLQESILTQKNKNHEFKRSIQNQKKRRRIR